MHKIIDKGNNYCHQYFSLRSPTVLHSWFVTHFSAFERILITSNLDLHIFIWILNPNILQLQTMSQCWSNVTSLSRHCHFATAKHFHYVISCVTEWKMESVWESFSYDQIVSPFWSPKFGPFWHFSLFTSFQLP